jgi:hypothetical protein
MELFSAECNAFIPKPINTDLLYEKIGQVLDIEWITHYTQKLKTESEQINLRQTENYYIPPNDILDEIIVRVNLGDFAGLNIIINKLSSDIKYGVFCDKINELAKKFDEESIIRLCRS